MFTSNLNRLGLILHLSQTPDVTIRQSPTDYSLDTRYHGELTWLRQPDGL